MVPKHDKSDQITLWYYYIIATKSYCSGGDTVPVRSGFCLCTVMRLMKIFINPVLFPARCAQFVEKLYNLLLLPT